MSTATLERSTVERPRSTTRVPDPVTAGTVTAGTVTAGTVTAGTVTVTGILDRQDQHGFLRTSGYLPGPGDLYITPATIRRYGLRPGDLITGTAAEPPDSEGQASTRTSANTSASTRKSARSNPAGKARPLDRIDTINGLPATAGPTRPHFAAMTPLYPQQRLRLETEPRQLLTRAIDLVTPIGKGQRGLIVAPPKTGKTTLLQAIAKAVTQNHPECHLMVVLLDERPEEVTDMRRSVAGEIIASTFDRPVTEHIAVAELAVERAKRLAEQGQDVVILLDSITRLCRAHNNNAKSSGRTLSGGVDASAVAAPKQLFGAARNLEEGGSITILATALIDTGSRADDYFFEELKSTGNMELRLDRSLADRRVFPAIDITGSSTRREELLMPAEELDAMWRLRRALRGQGGQGGPHGTEVLLERLKQTGSNSEFIQRVRQTTVSGG
ncbi:transcription termination factor Rho [Catenulispora sp. GP43]